MTKKLFIPANPDATNSELDSKRIISYNDTNLPNGITTPKENELSSLQRDELIEQFVELQTDSMDLDTMVEWIQDILTNDYDKLTDSELQERVDCYDEDLFDELVDNVTQQYPKQLNTFEKETFIDVNNTGGKY